jgi:hypothetical protein
VVAAVIAFATVMVVHAAFYGALWLVAAAIAPRRHRGQMAVADRQPTVPEGGGRQEATT